MGKITKENLELNPNVKNFYQTHFSVNGQNIEISINPDDVELERTIELANKILGNFEFYEYNAREKIIEKFFDIYNEEWMDEEEGFPELDKKTFGDNLILTSILFMSDSSIDFFYSENGMFGNHSLIAQSFDGENFRDATMFG